MENFLQKHPHAVQVLAHPSHHNSIHNQYIDTWSGIDQYGLIYKGCPLILHNMSSSETHFATAFRIVHLNPNLVAVTLFPRSENCPFRIIMSRKRELLQNSNHNKTPIPGQPTEDPGKTNKGRYAESPAMLIRNVGYAPSTK
jgi:hypothetical protein